MAYKEQQPKPLGEVGSKTTYTVKSGSKKELVKEHKRLVHVLRSPSREDDKDEAKLQEEELEEMEEGKDYKPAIKKSLERANDLIKAMKKGCDDKKDSLSEEEMDLEKKDDEKKEPNKVVKALKAAAILGLTRRQRMDTAYRLGLAQGVQAQKTPFATEDLSETPVKIGISEQQTRPNYEPPVVPVRKVNNNPGYIAPKPCGDHEYKTTTTGPSEAKPIKDR